MMTKHILLAVSGSVAAYKSCELVRLLKKQGHQVTVALSCAATEFVGAQTFLLTPPFCWVKSRFGSSSRALRPRPKPDCFFIMYGTPIFACREGSPPRPAYMLLFPCCACRKHKWGRRDWELPPAARCEEWPLQRPGPGRNAEPPAPPGWKIWRVRQTW